MEVDMEKTVSSTKEQEGIIILSEGREAPSNWPLGCCGAGLSLLM